MRSWISRACLEPRIQSCLMEALSWDFLGFYMSQYIPFYFHLNLCLVWFLSLSSERVLNNMDLIWLQVLIEASPLVNAFKKVSGIRAYLLSWTGCVHCNMVPGGVNTANGAALTSVVRKWGMGKLVDPLLCEVHLGLGIQGTVV